jgi:hypothetical protein
LVPLKRHGEIGCSATKDSTNREKLKRYPSIEQGRPRYTHLDLRAYADFVSRNDALGGHQGATTAHIDHTPRAIEKRHFEPRAEANAEVQWITES